MTAHNMDRHSKEWQEKYANEVKERRDRIELQEKYEKAMVESGQESPEIGKGLGGKPA